jgi:hypothetical protein
MATASTTGMSVNAISIRREGYYSSSYGAPDPSKPFSCTIEIQGRGSKTELMLSPEISQRIVELIAEEVAAAGRAAAEAMIASVISATPRAKVLA